MLAKALVIAGVVAASFAATAPASARCEELVSACTLSCLPTVSLEGPEYVEFHHYYC